MIHDECGIELFNFYVVGKILAEFSKAMNANEQEIISYQQSENK